MNKFSPENLSPERKKAVGYIEGHQELFASKVLEIGSETEKKNPNGNNILVIARDPGSANALVPVVSILKKEGMSIKALADSRAEEIIKANFEVKDISPENSVIESDLVVGQPDVVLSNASPSELGLDTYGADHFRDAPQVLLEDYYTSSFSYLNRLRELNLPFPSKICVMDQGAKNLIIDNFSELKNSVEITGQPSFDAIAKEDTETIYNTVRKKLAIAKKDKLVVYMPTMGNEPERLRDIAKNLHSTANQFYFVFRRHPRDNVSYDQYKKILEAEGIKVIDTQEFSTDEIASAADLVLTNFSTEGIKGIYRRKMTIHITDTRFGDIPKTLPLPLVPVKLGASAGVDNIDDLATTITYLLEPGSKLGKELAVNMDKYYPRDGKNAERVATVVTNLTKNNL